MLPVLIFPFNVHKIMLSVLLKLETLLITNAVNHLTLCSSANDGLKRVILRWCTHFFLKFVSTNIIKIPRVPYFLTPRQKNHVDLRSTMVTLWKPTSNERLDLGHFKLPDKNTGEVFLSNYC